MHESTGSVDVVFANAGISGGGKGSRQFLDGDEGEPVRPDLKVVEVNLVGGLYSISPRSPFFSYLVVSLGVSLVCLGYGRLMRGSDQTCDALYAET